MTRLIRYTGNSPMRVNKDAKYSVTAGGAIRLEYQESQRVRYLLTTEDHPDLADQVNRIKNVINSGREGGAFYINEFCCVLVPDGEGGPCYFAGHYFDELIFREDTLVVSPSARNLRPGDMWTGPHVGIPYVLTAGATDVRYDNVDGRRREAVLLSDSAGASDARKLAQRLGRIKGPQGGRIFINEQLEFFAPVGVAGNWEYKYLGHLDEDCWFLPPVGFEAPE